MDILSADEKLIKKIYPSRWYFWQFYLAGLFFLGLTSGVSSFESFIELNLTIIEIPEISDWLTFFLLILGLGTIVLVEFLRRIHTYYITDKKIIEEFSFLSRRVASIDYSHIQNINSSQSLPARIVGIGNLEFHTAGWGQTNKPEICFRGIRDPISLKNIVTESKLKVTSGEQPR